MDFEETHRRTDLKAGDVLMTNAGTIGRMAITNDLPETKRTTFQKSVAILKPNISFLNTYFLYSTLKSNIFEITELAGGSTQSNLLLGDLRTYKILIPLKKIVDHFENEATIIFNNINDRSINTQKLKELQSLLLAKMTKEKLLK